MKLEIDMGDVDGVVFKANKHPRGQMIYSVWVKPKWGEETYRILKTKEYQEALAAYQHLIGEMQS